MSEETLSEKINSVENLYDASNLANTSAEEHDWLWGDDVKEKIQNAQRRLLMMIREKNSWGAFEFDDEVSKIFLEEFGEKLI